MYGIDRFSKKAFIAYVENYEQNVKNYEQNVKVMAGDNAPTLDNILSLPWEHRLRAGRSFVLNQLKAEAVQGIIVNEKGRFSESALIERMQVLLKDIQATCKFNTGTGYSQIKDSKDGVKVQNYVKFDALRNLIQSCY